MPQVVLVMGDDVSTDLIYPGRYMATVLPGETGQFAFADQEEFRERLKAKQVPPGSVVVAGRNFGCGSSREQAVSCLKAHDLTVVARGFARIFLHNAINLGLRVVTSPEFEAERGDEVEIVKDRVLNRTRDRSARIEALPPARQAIAEAGGLIPYTRRRLMERETGKARPVGAVPQ